MTLLRINLMLISGLLFLYMGWLSIGAPVIYWLNLLVSRKFGKAAEMLGWGPRPGVERSGTPGTRR